MKLKGSPRDSPNPVWPDAAIEVGKPPPCSLAAGVLGEGQAGTGMVRRGLTQKRGRNGTHESNRASY